MGPLQADHLQAALLALGSEPVADLELRPEGPTEDDVPWLLGSVLARSQMNRAQRTTYDRGMAEEGRADEQALLDGQSPLGAARLRTVAPSGRRTLLQEAQRELGGALEGIRSLLDGRQNQASMATVRAEAWGTGPSAAWSGLGGVTPFRACPLHPPLSAGGDPVRGCSSAM